MKTWTLAAVELKSFKVGSKVPKQYNFFENIWQHFKKIYFVIGNVLFMTYFIKHLCCSGH